MKFSRVTLGVVLVLVLLIAFLLISKQTGYAFPAVANGKSYTIILTPDGFSPDQLTIHQGDTVIFKTTAGKFFWPASNPHPVHTDYPEFDPQNPIDPKSTWSFTFQRVGTWKFHDHLTPYNTGVITVLSHS